MTVAYQGEPGAFSERAARRLRPRARLLPLPDFAALFAALDARQAAAAVDAIVAPWENSLAGPVTAVQALWAERRCRVVAECTLPIHHCLLAMPGVRLRQLRSVASHPVALAQCRRFFAHHPWIEPVAAHDTAGSVRSMMAAGDRARGAVAGARAARSYGAVIRRRHIEDAADNRTRFLLLARS